MAKTEGSVGLYTLGCKVNQYESEAIAEACRGLGLEVLPPDEVCDAYIINTCTVTGEADRKARQFIRRAISRNPDAYIVVTGCFAQVSPHAVADIGGVDVICGNDRKLTSAGIVAGLIGGGHKNTSPTFYIGNIDAAGFEDMSISSFGRTRACVKIEDGCESHCTYCIIPAARGKIRSKVPEKVLDEIRTLTAGGCREVVLTGIETAAYGRDLDEVSLADLLEQVDSVPGIGRVRLGSMDPSLFKPDFIRRIARLKSLTPHFHLSVQSGCDSVLAGMKRKYNSKMVLDAMEGLRANIPGIQFTSDIIVGFPGESDVDFAETMAFAERARFLGIHVFAYSKRAGTPAATMPGQVPEAVKHARSASLIEKQSSIRREILSDVIAKSPIMDILPETFDGDFVYGHTASFIEVKVKADHRPAAGPLRVRLTGVDGDVCTAEITD